MKIIIGLGNKGEKYKNTRHNIGFQVIDYLTDKLNLNLILSKKFQAEIVKDQHERQDILLIKPQKFMNLSGMVAKKILSYYNVNTKKLIVICDDVNLPLGTIRIRKTGRAGGHNGLQSIIDHLKTDRFIRIRIGVAQLENRPSIAKKSESKISRRELVLSTFNKAEQSIINQMIKKVSSIILESIKKGDFKAHTY